MPFVDSNGVRVAYEVEGHGPAVVLVHGYTSNLWNHWYLTRWVAYLRRGYRVLTLDLRGHGRSDKPREPHEYTRERTSGDVFAAMDAAGIEDACIFGYSMGAMVAVEAMLREPQRFSSAVLGGMGPEWPADGNSPCLDEEGDDDVPRPYRRYGRLARTAMNWMYRYDPRAMRALRAGMFAGQQPMPSSRLGAITVPVLAVAGTRDRFCGPTRLLPELLPNCRRVVLPGQTHVSAVSDPRFKREVARFLAAARERRELPCTDRE